MLWLILAAPPLFSQFASTGFVSKDPILRLNGYLSLYEALSSSVKNMAPSQERSDAIERMAFTRKQILLDVDEIVKVDRDSLDAFPQIVQDLFTRTKVKMQADEFKKKLQELQRTIDDSPETQARLLISEIRAVLPNNVELEEYGNSLMKISTVPKDGPPWKGDEEHRKLIQELLKKDAKSE